ncbi:hypothetical protein swp_0621 [Shewanella piezotolerans WP3]|uniref:Uncharacterized protein n=1 Tax=Shewanella piezotolerans (strain WP3 / JCM 13877) TaxID=225849 RepID=B8CIG7_SHEPW|nr:hypothetical protein swp_0621 [Shewanella piezotolerans WP3]
MAVIGIAVRYLIGIVYPYGLDIKFSHLNGMIATQNN